MGFYVFCLWFQCATSSLNIIGHCFSSELGKAADSFEDYIEKGLRHWMLSIFLQKPLNNLCKMAGDPACRNPNFHVQASRALQCCLPACEGQGGSR